MRQSPRHTELLRLRRQPAVAVYIWRLSRPEGKTLSSTDTLENNPTSETPEDPHGHEGHDHDHDHEHQPRASAGPVLNPECTRELVLDVPAEEVSKAFRNVTRNYRKYAKIPGFRPGKVPESVSAADSPARFARK